MNGLLNLILTSVLITFSSNVFSQAGSNDPTFNADVSSICPNAGPDQIARIAIQPSGKIIIANPTSYNGVAIPRIARLTEDGVIDLTFNAGTGFNNSVQWIEQLPTGKLLVAGNFTTYNGVARNRIARLNSDGTLDTSFDPGTNVPGSMQGMSIQPDGKVLVSGFATGGFLRRLNTDGSLDPTFNSGTAAYNIYSTAVQSDNKIIAAGLFTLYNGVTVHSIIRLNTDGSLDPTFSSAIGDYTPYNIRIQPDDKILVAGNFPAFNGNPAFKGAVRLYPDGSVDPTFSVSGFNDNVNHIFLESDGNVLITGIFNIYNGTPVGPAVRFSSNGTLLNVGCSGYSNGHVGQLRLTNTGKFIAGGGFTTLSGYAYKRIARLNNNLTLDNSFNSGFGFGANDAVRCSALQPDGKIVIGGVFNTFSGITRNQFARLNSNGTLDNSFNALGDGPNADVISMRIQPDGKIVIGGGFWYYNDVFIRRIARVLPDGSIDPSFTPGTAADNLVYCIELQNDGKILIGGVFTSYDGNSSKSIARLNSNGTFDASFNVGTGSNGSVYSTPVQSDGKIIVTGTFTTFNGVTNNRILRLNSDGTIDASFTTGTGANNTVYTAIIQPDGKILIAGSFTSYNGVARNRIARLNNDGTLDLTFNPGTGSNNNVNTISLQSDGKIIVGGQFTMFNSVARNGIIRLNADGTVDSGFNPGNGINSGGVWSSVIQPDGNIIITGGFTSYNSIARNRIARISNTCPTSYFNTTKTDATCYNSNNGTITLSPTGGTAPYTFSWNDGNTNQNRSNLSPGTYTVSITDFSGCTASANALIEQPGPISPSTISINSCGSYFWSATGLTHSISGSYTTTLITSSGCDSIVTLNLTINNSTSGIDSQTACASYTWIDGNTYTSSTNSPTWTLTNAAGCDSILTLNLTINNSTSGIDSQTACGSYTWIDGNTYTSSTNSPTWTLTNAAGCDSIVTLNLTINNATTGTDTQMACGSYTWIDGNTYTSSTNSPTWTLTNALGCDSIVTLNLTINNATTGTDTQTACGSYTWIDGNTYTSSTNSPTWTLTNAAGCDSIVTLNLTINNATTGTDTQTACGSYTWIDGNTYTSSTNSPTWTLTNALGCDSIVTLNLTINNSTSGIDSQTACASYTWIDGNTYTSSTNSPTWTLTNAAGCDSIVTLNLTINNSTSGIDSQTACGSYTWIDGNTYTSSTNSPTWMLTNAAGCDSIVTLNLIITPLVTLSIDNIFSFPSDANTCTGETAIDISGNPDFIVNIDNGASVTTSSGFSLVTGLCHGVHDLFVTSECGDTLHTPLVIPVDSNYVFNNPFIDSLAQDSLGITLSNCDIYYAGIDTAYIDSLWANGNTVNVIWNIVDSNGSNFDTTTYELNNGNGVYWLQLSVFCPTKALGEYFTVTEAIYFADGNVSSAGLSDLEENSVWLYPNPTNDQVTISFDGNEAELTIYDAQGKLIQTSTIVSGTQISLKYVETGVYFFELTADSGRTVNRVVKN